MKLNSLQILRFFAALLVVVMHATQAISLRFTGVDIHWGLGGYGVDIFFVISGFVMVLAAPPVNSARVIRCRDAVEFFRRRFIRVVPLYWFYSLLKIVAVFIFPALALRSVFDPMHVLMSFGFVPWKSPWGLLEPILPVGWTLNFEMFFYSIFAIAIFFGVKRIAFIFCIFLFIFVLNNIFPENDVLAFYARTILFEFVFGMGIAIFYLSGKRVHPVFAVSAVVAGLVLLFFSNWPVDMERLISGGLGAGLLVFGVVFLDFIFKNKIFESISILGDASYSIYLSHGFVLPVAAILMIKIGVSNIGYASMFSTIAAVVLGVVAYKFIELPLVRWSKLLLSGMKFPDNLIVKNMRRSNFRYIYIACPWTPNGGGMFKVADYLTQCQHPESKLRPDLAEMRPLDTRGGGSALASMAYLLIALVKLIQGRLGRRLAGVHVNMAERLSLFRKAVVVVFARTIGLPVVLHLHAAQLHHFYRNLPMLLKFLVRWSFSLANEVVVLGAAARAFVQDELRVPSDRVSIVINGVPQPSVERRDASAPGAKLQLLFLGNLSERKGVSDLISAISKSQVAKLDNFEAIFAGKGDIEGYTAKTKEQGVDKVISFVGWADQKKAATLMANADVLVLPSYDEGLPLVILEALANSAAVICTPVGEIPNELQDGRDAAFVQPGDINGLANAIDSVLGNADLRKRLEQGGRALYERKYSLDMFADSIALVHQRCFGVASRTVSSLQ